MTLDRYLIREVAGPFLLGLSGLTCIFLVNQLMRLSDLFVGRGVGLGTLAQVLGVLLPPFLLITLPAAVLLSGLVAFSRLSADSEFIAMRASGLSFLRLMRPVMVFAALIAIVALALGLWAQPWGKGKLKHLAMEAIRDHAGLAITPGTFTDLFGNVVVFAEEASGDGRLQNIFISDERDPDNTLLVTARDGALVQAPDRNQIGLHLTGGEIYRQSNSVQRVQFDSYDVKLTIAASSKKVLSWPELQAEIARRKAAGEPQGRLLQLALDHTRNVTFGVACFLLGVLGPALGIHSIRSGRMGGFLQGVGVMLAYYMLINIAQTLVMNERVPIMVGAWLPNTVVAIATLYALIQAHRERPLLPSIPGLRRRQ